MHLMNFNLGLAFLARASHCTSVCPYRVSIIICPYPCFSRDCWGNNMMMEGWHLYPDGFHPIRKDRKRDYSGQAKHFTRTQRPPKYYLIDFGLSRRFSPDDRDPGARPIMGGDKSVPEMVNYESGTLNPFHTDIYYIGNMVKTDFIMVGNFLCSDLVIVILTLSGRQNAALNLWSCSSPIWFKMNPRSDRLWTRSSLGLKTYGRS
jgi:hypothetical protein